MRRHKNIGALFQGPSGFFRNTQRLRVRGFPPEMWDCAETLPYTVPQLQNPLLDASLPRFFHAIEHILHDAVEDALSGLVGAVSRDDGDSYAVVTDHPKLPCQISA